MSWKVAIHVHSAWSYDGTASLEEVARFFRRLHFDAVFMSEHDRGFDGAKWDAYQSACRDASRGLRLIPGLEYQDADNAVHVLVWGDLPFLSCGSTTELLRRVRGERGSRSRPAPARKDALARLTTIDHDLLDGVEIWNRRYDGWSPPDQVDAFSDRPELLRIVGLDFHRRLDFFPLALRLDPATEPTPEAATEALRSGRFVAELCGMPASHFSTGRRRAILQGLDHARKSFSRLAGIGS